MNLLTKEECQKYLSERGWDFVGASPPEDDSRWINRFKLKLPRDSGKKVALAKVLCNQLSDGFPLLILVSGFQAWPSSGHLPLFTRLRQSMGSERTFEDAPGHFFAKHEVDDAISVVVLGLQFYWDCLIVSESGKTAFMISHDEFYYVLNSDKGLADGLGETFLSGNWGEVLE